MTKQAFNDFSGGITDFPFNTASNYSEVMDNWVRLRDKTMRVREGFDFVDANATKVSSNGRTSAIIDMDGINVYISEGKGYYTADNDIYEIYAPAASDKLFHAADVNTMADHAKWGNQYLITDDSYSFPMKAFVDDQEVLRITNAGLPKMAGTPTISSLNNGSYNYIYAFVYERYYRVGGTLFLDLGEPIYVSHEAGSLPSDALPISINDIPILDNGADLNYDLATIKKRIYRTEQDGTTFHLVGTVDNGTTTYEDTNEDSEIVSGEVLYTAGGVLPNHAPPRAKYITISSNVAWYGNVMDGAEPKPYRLRFSKVGDMDSCPDSFFEDFEGDITGLTSIEDRVIVFTDKSAIRVQGVLDDLGRGSIIRDVIGDVPCVAAGSVVKTQDYVYWFGASGIYRTDGVRYEKLTQHLDESYQGWINSDTKKRHIRGAYDRVNQRIKWCINEGSADNDKILVFDEVLGGFHTESSGVDYSPTAILFRDDEMYRADADGWLFVHRKDIYSDLVKNPAIHHSLWTRKVIPYEWKHIAWDMGDSESVKWMTKINVSGRPKSNVYLEPRTYREGSVEYYKMAPMRFNPLMKWGDPTLLWGDPANRWNGVDYMNQSKRVHRKAKRVTHLQLSLASAKVKILASTENEDSYAAVNSVSKSVTLLNPADYKFSIDSQGHDVIIEGKAYEITGSSEDVLTVLDPDGTLPDGNYPWEVRGAPKGQRPHVSSISIHFEVMGNSDKMIGGEIA